MKDKLSLSDSVYPTLGFWEMTLLGKLIHHFDRTWPEEAGAGCEVVRGEDVGGVSVLETNDCLVGGSSEVGGFVTLGAGADGRDGETVVVEEYLELSNVLSFRTKFQRAVEGACAVRDRSRSDRGL